MRTRRLGPGDRAGASRLFQMMAEVFGEPSAPLNDEYLDRLLARADFWALAALDEGGDIIGGITAHTLPMTRSETSEIFIYDVAVRGDRQRQGVGRQLLQALREAAAATGIDELFVAADNEDDHALDFYRAVGGAAAPVTMFTFAGRDA
jgi:aminoglycoside 3-N-acetyltransferase I